ncbi:uncharacterized protein LOC142333255 [Lycorma delicatula]|uniref:uncharacterized protein LOC142333255 n=1 Tax=Lycorma delicatula TaxID=130591 RepID=UPI003F513C33
MSRSRLFLTSMPQVLLDHSRSFNVKILSKTLMHQKFFRNCIDVSSEVNEILINKSKPVVALESTIITHGMPFPHNLNTALQVEEIVRAQGAVPATIGIIDGRIKVGLNYEEILRLAKLPSVDKSGKNVVKTSRRDFPFVISKGLCGGTTVSGTIVVCSIVGINIFVTGGIGGVHRDGQFTMDVSADLTELSRNPVTVVSSGVKSILDVQRTLEYLETFGVCVVTYGDSKEFPSFYTRKSGCTSPYHVSTIDEAASLMLAVYNLNINSGMLLAVPVPSEHCALDHEEVEKIVSDSLNEARKKGIQGKEVTPFLLDKINQSTDKLLETNIALIKNNALIGSQVAVKFNNMIFSNNDDNKNTSWLPSYTGGSLLLKKPSTYGMKNSAECTCYPVVIGGSNLDCIVTALEHLKLDGRMLGSKIHQTGGGVARNLAEALAKFDMNPRFLSAVGNDLFGKFIREFTEPFVDLHDILICNDCSTSTCIVILHHETGENILLMGDMVIHKKLSTEYLTNKLDIIKGSSVILFDGNLPVDSMNMILNYSKQNNIPVLFEPTDIVTADKPFSSELWKNISFISPNIEELRRISSAVTGVPFKERSDHTAKIDIDKLLQEVIHLAVPLANYINTVMVTLGKHGLAIVGKTNDNFDISLDPSKFIRENCDNSWGMSMRYYKPLIANDIKSASGAGDCTVAGFMKGVMSGLNEPQSVSIGLSAAVDSLESINTVPDSFNVKEINTNANKPYCTPVVINI